MKVSEESFGSSDFITSEELAALNFATDIYAHKQRTTTKSETPLQLKGGGTEEIKILNALHDLLSNHTTKKNSGKNATPINLFNSASK